MNKSFLILLIFSTLLGHAFAGSGSQPLRHLQPADTPVVSVRQPLAPATPPKRPILSRMHNVPLSPASPATPADSTQPQKSLLSTLWIFATLNYLYCDIAGLMDAHLLAQYLTGVVGGMTINAGFLLAAGILMEIPMLMVLLSRVLKGKGNRTANIVAGSIMTLVQLATLFAGPFTMYYLFFSVIEIATTAFITWYAWKKMPRKATAVAAE